MTGPYHLDSGAVLQAGLAPQNLRPARAPGGLMRGVVVATYVTDDPQNPYNTQATNPCAVYCDVLVYGSPQGPNVNLLPNCLVSQDRAGIQSGDVWAPRAASMDVSGVPLSLANSNPHNLDGDHVLVGFLDDLSTCPVILRALPHPRTDVGLAQAEPALGQRVRLRRIDGSPDVRKHLGTVHGVSSSADFVVRTTYANDGTLTAKGATPAPPASASLGNMLVELHKRAQRLTELVDMDNPSSPQVVLQEILSMTQFQLKFVSAAAHLLVQDAQGVGIELKGGGSGAQLQVGDGKVHPAIAEHLMQLYTQLKVQFDSHVHPSSLGPTGPAQAAGFQAPAWDSAIKSTHVSIPDG